MLPRTLQDFLPRSPEASLCWGCPHFPSSWSPRASFSDHRGSEVCESVPASDFSLAVLPSASQALSAPFLWGCVIGTLRGRRDAGPKCWLGVGLALKLPIPSPQRLAEASGPSRGHSPGSSGMPGDHIWLGRVRPLPLRATGLTRALLLRRWWPRPRIPAAVWTHFLSLPHCPTSLPPLPGWRAVGSGRGRLSSLACFLPRLSLPQPGLVSPWRDSSGQSWAESWCWELSSGKALG